MTKNLPGLAEQKNLERAKNNARKKVSGQKATKATNDTDAA